MGPPGLSSVVLRGLASEGLSEDTEGGQSVSPHDENRRFRTQPAARSQPDSGPYNRLTGSYFQTEVLWQEVSPTDSLSMGQNDESNPQ